MSGFTDPRQSADFIAQHADHVSINNDAAASLADEILSAMRQDPEGWKNQWKSHELHPQIADEDAVEWIFFVDSLNFSFWTDGSVKYSVNGYTGYWSLCAAVNRCLKEDSFSNGLKVTDAAFYSHISLSQMEHIFRPDRDASGSVGVQIPLLKERVDVLQANGNILCRVRDKSCL